MSQDFSDRQVKIVIDPALRREFKAAVAIQGTTMREVLTAAINAYVGELRAGNVINQGNVVA